MTARDVILVRSLTDSDLGLFAAHREAARSKQRAININAVLAHQLLSKSSFESGGGEFDCVCRFGDLVSREKRFFGKVGKNWRLGGSKIQGDVFAQLDSKDFVLIRSVAENDGTHPLTITFIAKNNDRVLHAGIAAIVERSLDQSMALYAEGEPGFADVAKYCLPEPATVTRRPRSPATPPAPRTFNTPRMPRENDNTRDHPLKSIREKIRSPHLLEQMLKVAGDLSAPAQLRFMETVEQLASQLRQLLLATGQIIRIEKDHAGLWRSIAGHSVGFIDGGLANLSMLGSAPIAARVGGYMVTPGDRGPAREHFSVLKYLIDELYAHDENGVYTDTFPDIGALRDAARISIEAAGAVRMVADHPDLRCVFTHGALVNPVSRYTDVMQDERIRHRFPDFSDKAIKELLPSGTELLPPSEPPRTERPRNFVNVHLCQLELLQASNVVVCGVIERESTTSSVLRAVLESLDESLIRPLLPMPPAQWKHWSVTLSTHPVTIRWRASALRIRSCSGAPLNPENYLHQLSLIATMSGAGLERGIL